MLQQKWFIDATIQCFHGTHAVIGTIAVILVILSVLSIPFIGLACSEVILKVCYLASTYVCICILDTNASLTLK